MQIMHRRAIQYVQRHPWQAAEHLLCVTLLVLWLRCPHNPCTPPPPTPGPRHIFDTPEVRKAPPPTMDVSGLNPGEALHAADARGDIYRLVLQAPLFVVNTYFTKAVRRPLMKASS